MPVDGTHSVIQPRLVSHAAEAAGLDAGRLLEDAGIAAVVLGDVDARVPSGAVLQLWRSVSQELADPDFGLHLGEQERPGPVGLVAHLFIHSPTLGEAFATMCRYVRLMNDSATLELTVGADGSSLTYRVEAAVRPPRQLTDWVFAAMVVAGRRVTGVNWLPRAVHFEHPQPGDCTEYRRLFACPLSFGAPTNMLQLGADVTALESRLADRPLTAVLRRFADDLVDRLPQRDPFVGQLRRTLADMLPGGEPGIPAVADRLAVGRRTLQRRLNTLGTSYTQVLAELRSELAELHLARSEYTIGEVSLLLGYSDPSVFYRSFRKWNQMTPSQYRRGRSGIQPAE